MGDMVQFGAMKTRFCDDCKFCDMTVEVGMKCGKGHNPRFYMPKGTYPHYENDWGWKRKCIDFAEGVPKGITVQRIDLSLNLTLSPLDH